MQPPSRSCHCLMIPLESTVASTIHPVRASSLPLLPSWRIAGGLAECLEPRPGPEPPTVSGRQPIFSVDRERNRSDIRRWYAPRRSDHGRQANPRSSPNHRHSRSPGPGRPGRTRHTRAGLSPMRSCRRHRRRHPKSRSAHDRQPKRRFDRRARRSRIQRRRHGLGTSRYVAPVQTSHSFTARSRPTVATIWPSCENTTRYTVRYTKSAHPFNEKMWRRVVESQSPTPSPETANVLPSGEIAIEWTQPLGTWISDSLPLVRKSQTITRPLRPHEIGACRPARRAPPRLHRYVRSACTSACRQPNPRAGRSYPHWRLPGFGRRVRTRRTRFHPHGRVEPNAPAASRRPRGERSCLRRKSPRCGRQVRIRRDRPRPRVLKGPVGRRGRAASQNTIRNPRHVGPARLGSIARQQLDGLADLIGADQVECPIEIGGIMMTIQDKLASEETVVQPPDGLRRPHSNNKRSSHRSGKQDHDQEQGDRQRVAPAPAARRARHGRPAAPGSTRPASQRSRSSATASAEAYLAADPFPGISGRSSPGRGRFAVRTVLGGSGRLFADLFQSLERRVARNGGSPGQEGIEDRPRGRGRRSAVVTAPFRPVACSGAM